MTKTTKMLLIEERASRDIREVMAAAYDQTQSIQRAAELIGSQYGEPVSFGIFSDWVESFGGSYGKKLQFPTVELDEEPQTIAARDLATA